MAGFFMPLKQSKKKSFIFCKENEAPLIRRLASLDSIFPTLGLSRSGYAGIISA